MKSVKTIKMADARLNGHEMAAAIGCMMDGKLRAGEYVKKFEQEVAQRVGAYNAIAVTNGTTALYMVFKTILKPGDRVIIPAFNFIAAANAVVLAGGVPVFVDVDISTWNIDLERMERVLMYDKPIRAICPVHLFGNPCRVDEIEGIAHRHGALVVWDACQALGAHIGGRPLGGQGFATVYSFYPTKPCFAAEGGAICYPVANDGYGEWAIYPFREHGWGESKYVSRSIGGNFRMNELSAAIGWSQLKGGYQEKREKQRIAVAEVIRAGVEGVAQVQEVTQGGKSVFSVLALWVEHREEVREQLTRDGIETSIHYPVGLHRQPSMKEFKADCPVTDHLTEGILSVPCHHGMTIRDAERVVESIKAAVKG